MKKKLLTESRKVVPLIALQHCGGHVLIEQANRLLDGGDFLGYLLCFSSEHSGIAFKAMAPILSDEAYWNLLGHAWSRVEGAGTDKRYWRRWFLSSRPGREMMMDKTERAAFSRMPSELKIYRGFTHKGGEDGWSWTLDRKRAVFFTNYGNGGRRAMYGLSGGGRFLLATGKCKKSDVIAYQNGRKEREIIIDHRKVFGMSVKELKPPVPTGS